MLKRIGGVNMNMIAQRYTTNVVTKEKNKKRYCSICDSLKSSLHEVSLHRDGKLQLSTWDEFKEEISK